MSTFSGYSSHVVVSRRLRDLLHQSESYPLTEFYGPSGCGKTAALLQLRGPNVRSVLLNAPQGAPEEFWPLLCSLMAPGADPEQPLPLLAAAIAAQGPLLVLIDDYHNAATPALSERLLQLALAVPGQLRVALASRPCPWLPQSRQVSGGHVLDIGPRDLALEAEDCAALFRERGVRLTSTEVQDVYRITQGWPIAVNRLLSEKLRSDLLQLPASFFRMMNHWLDDLPEPLPAFVLWLTPLAEDFSVAQAAFLWRSPKAADLLEQLESLSFCLTMDSATGHYRFHPLMVRVLRTRLEASALNAQVHARLARWYLQQQDYLPALHSLHRAGDTDSLLDVLNRTYVPGLIDEPISTIESWYAACTPTQFNNYPLTLLHFAWCFFLRGEHSRMIEARTLFLEQMKRQTPGSEAARWMKYAYQAYLASVCLYLQELPNYYRTLMQEPQPTISHVRLLCHPVLFGCPTVFGVFRNTGLIPLSAPELAELANRSSSLTGGQLGALLCAAQAEEHFLQGSFDEARVAGHRALRLARESGSWNTFLSMRFLQCKFYFLRGRPDRVQDVLNSLRRETLEQPGPHTLYLNTLEQIRTSFYLAANQVRLIPNWILSGDLNAAGLLAPARAYALQLHAFSLLQRGLHSQVLGLEDALLNPDATPILQIYNLLILCVAHERLRAPLRANSYLQHAAAMAQTRGILMPFVELYLFLQPVIDRYTGTWKALHRRIPELGARFAQQCSPTLLAHTHTEQGLSGRENQVAHLAARGLYNREIAKQLSISENTVKSTLQAVYTKLKINSRRELPDALKTGKVRL